MKSLLFFTVLAGIIVFQTNSLAYEKDQSNFKNNRYSGTSIKIAQRGSFGNGFRSRSRNRKSLSVGQVAPDFKLATKDGKYQVRLSSYRNKKPVVLIFGSYT